MAVVREAPAPTPPVTLTPSVVADTVAYRVEDRVIFPVTVTLFDPNEARTESVEVSGGATSAVAWAAAPATKMPPAKAVEEASAFCVAMELTDKLPAPDEFPARALIVPSICARVEV